jgi:hypothetical protein
MICFVVQEQRLLVGQEEDAEHAGEPLVLDLFSVF